MTPDEVREAHQAMPLKEVSLLVRTRYKEDAILREIQRRHVVEKPDGATEKALTQAGASSAVIAALKSGENVLSPRQKEEYLAFSEDRAVRTQLAAGARLSEAQAEEAAAEQERQRKQGLFQQTVQNARNNEYKEAAYQQADRAYKARRESLEAQIVAQENYVNRRRSGGCSEADLRNANATLDRLKEDLRNLAPPLR